MKIFINTQGMSTNLLVVYLHFTCNVLGSIQPSPSSDKEIFCRKNSLAPNNIDFDENTDLKHSNNKSSFSKYKSLAKQLDSFEVYFVIWDKDADKLTGIVSNNVFNDLDNLIKHQQRVISELMPFFELENRLSRSSKREFFILNLQDFIISFKKILQIWNFILNKIKSVSSVKINEIDEKIKNIKNFIAIYKDESNKENERPRSTFLMIANSPEREFKNISAQMNNCEFIYGMFKQEKVGFIIEYIASFDQIIYELINKLQIINEKITAFNLEIIPEVQEELKRIFSLFDENEEDTIIYLVKKIKEMNVYLCEELERYYKKYYGFLEKLECLNKNPIYS